MNVVSIYFAETPLSTQHVYGHRAFGKRVIKYMTKKGKDSFS